MKNSFACAVTVLFSVFAAGADSGPRLASSELTDPVIDTASTPVDVPSIVPKLRNFRALDAKRDQSDWSEKGDGSGPVAFSVSGDNMLSTGPEAVVRYKTTHTNTHEWAWMNGGSHFRVPIAGIYLITVSFTNEYSPPSAGDDVYFVVRKNGEAKGFAFAGATELQDCQRQGNKPRTTGSYSVALDLATDDVIHTGVVDDMKRTRFIRFYNLTGVLVHPRRAPK